LEILQVQLDFENPKQQITLPVKLSISEQAASLAIKLPSRRRFYLRRFTPL